MFGAGTAGGMEDITSKQLVTGGYSLLGGSATQEKRLLKDGWRSQVASFASLDLFAVFDYL